MLFGLQTSKIPLRELIQYPFSNCGFEQLIRQGALLVISDLGPVSCVRASSLGSWGEEEEAGEERTIFTSGGTYYLALNTTYLLWWSLLLGGLLLGALFLTSGGGASAGAGAGYGGYQQLQQRGDTLGQQQALTRNRRESADWGEPLSQGSSSHSFPGQSCA